MVRINLTRNLTICSPRSVSHHLTRDALFFTQIDPKACQKPKKQAKQHRIRLDKADSIWYIILAGKISWYSSVGRAADL